MKPYTEPIGRRGKECDIMAAKEGMTARGAAHNINMKGRRSLQVSGVWDVLSFDESSVVMQTSMGTLSIDGEDLRIASFVSPQNGASEAGGGTHRTTFFSEDGDRGMEGESRPGNVPGSILIEGTVNALIYTDDEEPRERGGLFGIFRKR